MIDAGRLRFRSLDELLDWCRRAPVGTSVDAAALASILAEVAPEMPLERLAPAVDAEGEESWRVKLWSVPAETRLGVSEVAEAVGRQRSWVYKHTTGKARDRLPHRRLDRVLVFQAGELRTWIRDHEIEIVTGPSESSPNERHLRVHSGGRR